MNASQVPDSVEILKKKRLDALQWSEKAIRQYPAVYCEVKAMINDILNRPVDISEYYHMASLLSDLLHSLSQIGGETIFHYYYPLIDPKQNNNVRYFRAMCIDLADQLQKIDCWRMSQRKIRIVK